jgi:hypothetical protein
MHAGRLSELSPVGTGCEGNKRHLAVSGVSPQLSCAIAMLNIRHVRAGVRCICVDRAAAGARQHGSAGRRPRRVGADGSRCLVMLRTILSHKVKTMRQTSNLPYLSKVTLDVKAGLNMPDALDEPLHLQRAMNSPCCPDAPATALLLA